MTAGLVIWWAISSWQAMSVIPEMESRISSQIEFVKTLAQITLGTLVLVSLYVAWRRVKAAESAAEAAQKTIAVAQEGQITERFTRAIEQLGSDKSAIRLGGIYALERIAKDSEKDRRQVIEVLTAFIRENSKWDGQPEDEQSFQPVSTDIQGILTILGGLNTEYEEPEQRLNLHGTNLQGAEAMRTKLQWAILSNANLQRANFSGSILQGVILTYSCLQGADLSFANLWGVNFAGAKLQHAVLFNANLEAAYFKGADLQDADIRNTDLHEVIGLTQEQVDSTIRDANTKLPEYLAGAQNS